LKNNETLEAGVQGGSDTVNILIVDDEPKNLIVLETVLDDPSYRLVRANSGDEALLALMANEFAVLVLDVRMPGMTGFELAQMVKDRKRTARIPIIFLTAYYNEDQHILTGYGSGAVDYLHKPVNPAVLRSKVSVFAELHRKGRALEAANRSLQDLNESLDRRVTERTTALLESEARLLEANRRKDEFLATLAHELRNPLAPVRNAVQLLRMKAPDAARLDWASALIDRQVTSMSRLIDDLMDVSRINQGRIELRTECIELVPVLQEAIETTRPLIDEAGHELNLSLPQQPVLVMGDRTRLAQAFMNLLNNAAKYTDRGGRIDLAMRQEQGEVFVSFKDTGIGIAPDQLAGVFEMFSQVESALSRSRGGLGIGLSLTQRLIHMHGGEVMARSEGPGKGSEFVVRLPLVGKQGQGATGACAEPLIQPGAPGSGLKVLVADDNVDAADTLALLLETMGHTVRQAHDGEAAVRAAAEFLPQLALLDIGMPRMNGYEACRQIRTQPAGKSMTLVAVTGWGQPDDVRNSQQAGFDRHLVKPVDPAALVELIASLGEAAAGR
jgi:signal transduction histidine kinase